MEVDEKYVRLEFGVWRNGQPMSPLAYHGLELRPGQFMFRQPDLASAAGAFDIWLRLGNVEPVDGWITGEMGLSDHYGYRISTFRPALIFTRPSDIPMTVAFPSSVEGEYGGMWVVSMRAVHGEYYLPAPAGDE